MYLRLDHPPPPKKTNIKKKLMIGTLTNGNSHITNNCNNQYICHMHLNLVVVWFTTQYRCQSDHISLFNLCCNGGIFLWFTTEPCDLGKELQNVVIQVEIALYFFNVDIFFTPKGQPRSTIILRSFCLKLKSDTSYWQEDSTLALQSTKRILVFAY